MHKFLRAAGFSMYTKKKDIEKLLDLLERQPSMTRCVQVDEESNVCEMRTEVAPGLGISIIGELNEEGNFEREFYFPYQESHIIGSTEECSVQRHTEKETYSGMVDENKVFRGGVICPGLSTGLRALGERCAQLPQVHLSSPKSAIGVDTEKCMLSGSVLGTAVLLDGITQRIEEDLGRPATLVVTGGLANSPSGTA